MKEKAMRKYNAQMKINEIKIFVRGERGGRVVGEGGEKKAGKSTGSTRFFHVIKMFSSLYYQFF